MKKTCLHCKKEYDTGNKRRKFCSHPCSTEHGKLPRHKCDNCGKIIPIRRRENDRHFCDHKCYKEFNDIKLECGNCRKIFTVSPVQAKNKKFCSSKCNYESKRVTKPCKYCGKFFTTQKKNQEKIFCDINCYFESLKKYKKCSGCGKDFCSNNKDKNQKYCSLSCFNSSKPKFTGNKKQCTKCGKYKEEEDFRVSRGKLTARCRRCCQDNLYQFRYSISVEEVEALKKKQDGKCAICGKVSQKLHLDHCHKTNKVRGLLCNLCNQGLGRFQDSIPSLKNAIKYLEVNI